MKIGNRFFDTKNHTYIMGILNVTPDSFSDGGKWNHMDEALKHTEAMIADGADIIDIGGESTRPGHTPVSADEEAQRVLPVIEAVKKHFDIPVSVDTFKSSVAESSIQAGADQNLGFPVLLGTSRKSMIGLALDLPVDQRVEGTLATSVIGVMKGCSFVRVHDVKENKRVIQMTEAILGRR